MERPVIAFLSDLGEKDYFVAAMKGVVLSLNPEAVLVDISHGIPKFDVRAAAFTLVQSARSFPPGTIFIVVVDPGVGTSRKCILLRTKNGMSFIGPDNGVFTLVAREFGVEEIREISNPKLMLPEISATFHGRDVMAPVAAHLSLGLSPSEVGRKLRRMVHLPIRRAQVKGSVIRGEVLHVDDFGNLITNIPASAVSGLTGKRVRVGVGGREMRVKLTRTFGEVPPGEFLCCVGSAGFLEFAKNKGSAALELKVKTGARVIIKR